MRALSVFENAKNRWNETRLALEQLNLYFPALSLCHRQNTNDPAEEFGGGRICSPGGVSCGITQGGIFYDRERENLHPHHRNHPELWHLSDGGCGDFGGVAL